MSYVFKFDCFDEVKNSELDHWDRQIKHVNVAIVADTVDEAEATAKNLVVREKYELDSISELTELNNSYN